MKPYGRSTRMGLGMAVIFGAFSLAAPVSAQDTPGDLRDLVGARAAGGETQLQARGYTNVGGGVGDDTSWTYWWNAQRAACVTVATRNGRYDSIVATTAPDCGRGGGSTNSAGSRPHDFGYGDSYDRDGYREHFALLCTGQGHRSGTQAETGYQWDSDRNRYVPRTGYTWTEQDYNTSVTIEIDGRQGRIRPANNMVPPLHSGADNGWYDLTDLSVSRDTIRGGFRFSALNKPKFRIDRRAGQIEIEGLTPFSGTCQPLDSDRRF